MIRDAKHLRFIRLLMCLKCGIGSLIQAAHVRKFSYCGGGRKPSDDRAVPLCAKCHAEQHRIGEISFWGSEDKVRRVIEAGKELYAVTGDIFKGQRVVMKARKDLM